MRHLRLSLPRPKNLRALGLLPLALLGAAHPAQAWIDVTRLSIWGSSTAELLGGPLQAAANALQLTFFNGGDGGSYADTILAQHGSAPASLTFTQADLDRLQSASGASTIAIPGLRLNHQVRSWTGTLAGTDVTGTLSYSVTDAAWVFTRSGGSGALVAGTAYSFVPTVGTAYADGFQVLNIGKNDFFIDGSVDAIVAMTTTAYDSLQDAGDRVLVLGHFVQASASDALKARILAVNAALQARYGERFLDLQAYITSAQIWVDLGITPTADDLDHQARGLKAPSLSADDLHLTVAGSNAVVTHLIRPQLAALLGAALTELQVTRVSTSLLPILSGVVGAGHDRVTQSARSDRSLLHHDWRQGIPDGLRFTAAYGLSRADDSLDTDNNAGLGLTYGQDGWRIGLEFQRHAQDLSTGGGLAALEGQQLTVSLSRSLADWHMSARLGFGQGYVNGRSLDGIVTRYDGDLDSRSLEIELARSMDQGDWTLLPATWLRRQQINLDGLDYGLTGGTSGSLAAQSSSATIFGIGLDVAWQGWKDSPARVIPALRVSYETVLDRDADDWGFGTVALAGEDLGRGAGFGSDDSLLIEPSVAFGSPTTGQALISGWYDSGSKGHGLDMRWLYRF